jgi:gliding motility-associated-like protein
MDLTLCDDDNNGVMAFDLSSQDGFINSASGMSISYHLSQLDADTGAASNPLSSPYESGIDTIYVRLENNGNTDCYDTTSFEIEVFELAFPLDSANIDSIEECDNISVGTDTDGFIVFDLTQRETDILNGQDSSVFTLTYFTDAGYTNQIPVAQETAFENTTAGGQTVYVRMTNNLNATCYDDTSFEISVFELPVLNSPPFVLEQCDDDFDGYNSFNLTEINSEIITTITTEIFTYYESSAEAEAGIVGTEITNPTTYPNKTPNVDNDLWVRVETTGGCYRTTQATLIVKPSEILTSFIRTFSECDDGTDNRDGIATFDFSSVTAEVEAIFPTAVDVFYYRNEADATAEINEIVDPTAYENIGYEDMQEVWVRADSQLGNDCLGNGHHITLIVEKLPTANKPTDLTECDDDGDGEFPFDISMVETEILNGQSLADVTITYFNEDGTTIGSSLPNPFLTASQTIDIVITNNTTNDPEGVCTDKTTLTFVVDDSPEAATVIMAPSCDDNPNDTDGVSIFDTTSLESDILNSQTGMNVYYYDASGVDPLKDSNGVVITSPFPSSFSTATQTITVVVENPKNTTCTAITTVDFIVLPNPVYDLEEETLVCENLLPHRISVENPNQSNYNYQWFNSLGVEIGTDQILSIINTDDLTAEGVDYTVTVTNPITTCSKTKSILVRVSSLATITEDDIVTIEFNSPGNSIEINTTNLGIGDYEFSLEHDYDYQPFQDEPIFTGLLGGIYTLLVNDKIGCGEMELTIVLLDYPKFLTPNNDGYNDTWKLVGIESTSFTVSPIQIFDRFGKIVAILDPQSSGWDGYYNGIQLPASDYWFRVQLTNSEGTTLDEKGNFSLIRR